MRFKKLKSNAMISTYYKRPSHLRLGVLFSVLLALTAAAYFLVPAVSASIPVRVIGPCGAEPPTAT